MALTDQQISELNATYTRPGGQTATDLKNIAFAKTQGYTAPNIPDTINAEDLATPKAPVVPQMTTPQEATQAAAKKVASAGRTNQYADLIKQVEASTPAEATNTSLTDQLKSALEQVKGKGTDLAAEQEKLGVSANVTKLNELNQQIAQLQAGLNLGLAKEEARPVARQFMAGRQAEMTRQATAEIGALATVAQALQGNIALAKQTAQETINLKYADKEQEIENTKTLIDLNYKQMTLEQQKKADKLNLELKARQEEIDSQKLIDSGIQNIMLQAAENGADANTLQKIGQSTNIQRAITNAGSFMMKPLTTETGSPTKIGQNSKGEDIFYYNGQVVTGNQLLGEVGSSVGDIIAETFDNEAYNNAVAIRDGQLKLTDIKDEEMKQRVLNVQKTLPPSERAVADAEKMINNLETLLNHPGLDSAVGATPFSRGAFAVKDVFGNTDAFLGLANQVISSKALGALIDAKSQGATFGALSDTEMAILRAAATSLGAWEKTKDGQITKFDVDENSFKTEINKLITEYKSLVEKAKDPLQLFNNEGQTSVKTDVSKIKDGSKVITSIGSGTATGIQGGSSAWKYGFDFVLSGGKGAKVPAPVGGEVVFAGNAKTPGNQVRIRMPNGEEMWISHLDSINVKKGQKITAKTIIGTQGNTGLVLNNKGQKLSPAEVASGRGTHLDITMKKPDGTYYTSQEVASLLGTKLI